jgi:RND family efflux transporter MFP subunit
MKQIITICFGALFLFCSCGKNKVPTGWSDTTLVKIMIVNDGTTPTERNYVGDIGSEREATLSFLLGGTLTNVAVKNGQQVTKGQLIAEVDATTANSLYATALATLRQAEDAYRRLQSLHKEGGLSDVKWIEMETNLEKARQAEVTARKHKEDCVKRAPFNGVISCSARQEGQEMKPGEPYARIVDMTKLRVDFSVPEQEIPLIQVGDMATATVPALDDRKITLRVNDKSLIANPLGHTYKVHAAIVSDNVKDILPDMVAKVNIQLNTQGGIVVPADCVQTMPEGNTVWVIENGTAQHRTIVVGDFIRNGVVVKEGLSAGDTVITAGQQKLFTGAKVKFEN